MRFLSTQGIKEKEFYWVIYLLQREEILIMEYFKQSRLLKRDTLHNPQDSCHLLKY